MPSVTSPEQFHEWMNRKVTKRPVMCTPYGVTRTALGTTSEMALLRRKREFDRCQLTTITNAIFRKAIPEVSAWPDQGHGMAQALSAGEILDSRREGHQWTTPSGFVVNTGPDEVQHSRG